MKYSHAVINNEILIDSHMHPNIEIGDLVKIEGTEELGRVLGVTHNFVRLKFKGSFYPENHAINYDKIEVLKPDTHPEYFV